MTIRLLEFVPVAVWLVLAQPALAQPLAMPSGEVVLTIDGAITNTNVDGTAQFDMSMLEALPKVSIRTTTPWTDGVVEFTGVPLDVLLKQVGVTGSKLLAAAVNDYQVELPVTDEHGVDPLVAYLKDGMPMPVRDNGPLWVIYPFDDKPITRTETYYARSIWQLARISIEP